MKKYLQLYIKVFLFFAIGMGIAMSIIPLLLTGHIFETSLFVWQASFGGGVIFSLIIVTLHIIRSRNVPTSEKANLSPNQSRTIILDTDISRAYNLCGSSLMSISAKIIESNDAGKSIKARTPMSFWSWGEIIEIKVSAIANNKSQIIVTSKPSLKTTLVDYGKNTENVEKLCWYLNEKMETLP